MDENFFQHFWYFWDLANSRISHIKYFWKYANVLFSSPFLVPLGCNNICLIILYESPIVKEKILPWTNCNIPTSLGLLCRYVYVGTRWRAHFGRAKWRFGIAQDPLAFENNISVKIPWQLITIFRPRFLDN